jgi:cytochrome c peroxidase
MARQAEVLDIIPITLSDEDVIDLVEFLNALTSETEPPLGRPEQVPSGLPVD